MTLWGGRFKQKLDPAAWELNASIGFDRRLAAEDIRGSQAWAGALQRAGVINGEECQMICDGLTAIAREFNENSFVYRPEDEDIHTAIERRLGELIGSPAGKLHTGRSRNDQVATSLRLWLMAHIPTLQKGVLDLQEALVGRAEADRGTILPGYTHLQRAQPVLLSHWWLAHFWPLQRDRERLEEIARRTACLPLGCGALAGTSLAIDRQALAEELGFLSMAPNSIDAVSDRDFAAEFLFWGALTGIHLSRLAEAVILFSTAEFGFLELADAYATGSSLMPQKKNPDVFELARGKSGSLLGNLTGLMTSLKGLPSAYDKDLQEDKVPVFQAFDTLAALLPVIAGALRTLTIHPERMRAAVDANMLATDLADYLAQKGTPFREAHGLAGKAVLKAASQRKGLNELPLEELQAISPAFGRDVYGVFDLEQSLARRHAYGGTAPAAVAEQLRLAKDKLAAGKAAGAIPLQSK